MTMTTSEEYYTKDLMFAGALLALGIPLIATRNTDDYLVFAFGTPKEAEQAEREWWAGTLFVNATKYAEAVKRLKNLVYSRNLV
ncbi:hypothetical protein KKA27_03445 [Patescibacteria group bacterium]|nr:hypothetical protein [Patescibacteria group bacterium]